MIKIKIRWENKDRKIKENPIEKHIEIRVRLAAV